MAKKYVERVITKENVDLYYCAKLLYSVVDEFERCNVPSDICNELINIVFRIDKMIGEPIECDELETIILELGTIENDC